MPHPLAETDPVGETDHSSFRPSGIILCSNPAPLSERIVFPAAQYNIKSYS